MDYQLITAEEYRTLLRKLDAIAETMERKMEPHKKIYSEPDVCNELSCSKRTMVNLRKQKLITYSKINGKLYYTWENIQEFLKKHEVETRDF